MPLPIYFEIQVVLDANGAGTMTFQPITTYGQGGSCTLTINGGVSGAGIISINNNVLGPISLAQGFGPFNVYPGGQVSIAITGGPTNGTLVGVLAGNTYLAGETVPAQNLQFSTPIVQSSDVLVYETQVRSDIQHVYGPFSTEQFTALTLRVEGGPSHYSAGLDWFGDQAMTEECGSVEWVGGKVEADNTESSDIGVTWGNLGPWVRLTVTPHGS